MNQYLRFTFLYVNLFYIQLTINKLSIQVDVDWILIWVLWCRKQPPSVQKCSDWISLQIVSLLATIDYFLNNWLGQLSNYSHKKVFTLVISV